MYGKHGNLTKAAAQSEMDEKTARKYVRTRRLPSERRHDRSWRSRPDPFEREWLEIEKMLENSPGLEAKTIFEFLLRREPGIYQEGQLRSLQRRLKRWRLTDGPGKDVMFPQDHIPGRLCASAPRILRT